MSKSFLQYKPEQLLYRGGWIHNWFSNMNPEPIEIKINGNLYKAKSAEHAYQASKCEFETDSLIILSCETPELAKKTGKRVRIRGDWDMVKDIVMTEIQLYRFHNNTTFRCMLLGTNPKQPIIEWNNWGDIYWGVSTNDECTGQNKLGYILTEIRDNYLLNQMEQHYTLDNVQEAFIYRRHTTNEIQAVEVTINNQQHILYTPTNKHPHYILHPTVDDTGSNHERYVANMLNVLKSYVFVKTPLNIQAIKRSESNTHYYYVII